MRVVAPKSNCSQAPSSALLDQRVPALPSIAIDAAVLLPSTADDVAATGFTATPGLLASTGIGVGSCGVPAAVPV
jgi:hypothetical protein